MNENLMAEPARKFDDNGVNVSILGRNIQVTPSMKEHIEVRMDKVREMCPPATDIRVYLEVQKDEHRAEILFHFSHFHVAVHAHSFDLYQAFDSCIAKLKAKLRKWKTRIQEHHGKSIAEVEIDSNVLDRNKQELYEINDMIEEENLHEVEEVLKPLAVMRREKRNIPLLTVDEASMRFDLCGESFLVYREEKDQKIKVMCYDKNHDLTVLELE
ncbi:ribosome-associated translation inhibitor RaiA [bacterium]|nr:ribosome-associated translation inhibitor RaiA [bacterium]